MILHSIECSITDRVDLAIFSSIDKSVSVISRGAVQYPRLSASSKTSLCLGVSNFSFVERVDLTLIWRFPNLISLTKSLAC